MSLEYIKNEYYLPHQAIIITKRKNVDDFNINKILTAYWMRKDNIGDDSAIWEIEIHPTNFCNLECNGCSYGSRHDNTTIDYVKLVETINYYNQFDIRSLFFSGGGDPLCWNKYETFLKEVKRKRWKLGVSTNLYNIFSIKNIINEFDIYQIHLMGFDKESVLKECKVDAFDRIDKNCAFLFSQKEEHQVVTLKIVINNTNYNRLDKYLDYMSKFDCDSIVIKTEQDFLSNKNVFNEANYNYLRNIIQSHQIVNKFDFIIDNLDDQLFYNPSPQECYVANSRMYSLIRTDGEIYPCVASTYNNNNSFANISSVPEKKDCSNRYTNNMLSQRCPLKACRHYRFNLCISDYLQGIIEDEAIRQITPPTLL